MLPIKTKVIVGEDVMSADVWGLTEEQRAGTVVGHMHGKFNIVLLDDGMTRMGVDVAAGPVAGSPFWQSAEPADVRGWLALDDEVEVVD